MKTNKQPKETALKQLQEYQEAYDKQQSENNQQLGQTPLGGLNYPYGSCPQCGYCPRCGRGNTQPYYGPPVHGMAISGNY